MSATVALRWVDRLGTLPREERRPGDAKWARNPRGEAQLLFVCPCGCGDFIAVECSTEGHTTVAGRPCWTWNGDRQKPTLRPSIHFTAGCRWHGWLTDGVFTTA